MQQVSILGFKTFRTPSLCCGAKSPETSFMLPSSRTPGNLLALKELHPEVAARHIEKSSAGKGFGKPQPKSKKKKPQLEMQQAKAKAEIDKPFASQLNRELSTADKVEETIVRTLAFLFVVFFSEGLFLAVAGFLPEAADDFAVKYVYPAFSPTLGVFLAISVVYGLLKASLSVPRGNNLKAVDREPIVWTAIKSQD